MILSKVKKVPIKGLFYTMAENMRFELTEACTSPPFQDGALNHSANSPVNIILNENVILSRVL